MIHHTRQEIRFLRAAMLRVETLMEPMQSEFEDDGGCCLSCVFGDRWDRLARKLERQEAWMKVLQARLRRQSGLPVPMPRMVMMVIVPSERVNVRITPIPAKWLATALRNR